MKLFIGVCNSQHEVPDGFFWSVMQIKKVCEYEIFRSTHPWDVIRNNRIIDRFLKSDCDVMVKMDIDQVYPIDFFAHFVPLICTYKAIGPLIKDRHRENNYMPLAFRKRDGMLLYKMDITGKTGIHEIPYAHTNLFYDREIFEQLPKPWYEAYATEDGLERANHVDFTFLDKIKNAGYPIYIDLDMKVGHKKPPEYVT